MLGGYLKFPWHPRVAPFQGEGPHPCFQGKFSLGAQHYITVACGSLSRLAFAMPAGHTTYVLNDRGLIQLQDQTWSISGAAALVESFTPTAGVDDAMRRAVLEG